MKDYTHTNENIRQKIKEIKLIQQTEPFKSKKMEDALVLSLAYLVYSAIRRYKKFNNYEDLYQEGMIGLIKAVQHYDADSTFHFTRYALWWIRSRISRSIKKLNLMTIYSNESGKYFIQYDVSENDIIEYNNPEKNAILSENIVNLYIMVNTLPEKHQQLIKMRYGLNDTQEYSLQNLGNKWKMTREGIRQLEYRIISKLQNNILKINLVNH